MVFTVCCCLIANSWARRDRTGTSVIDWHLPTCEAQTAVTPRYGHDHRVRQSELSGANMWGVDVSPPVCSLISLRHQHVPMLNYLSLWGISTQGGYILMTEACDHGYPPITSIISYSPALYTSKFYFRRISGIHVKLDVSVQNTTKRMWGFDRFSSSRARSDGLMFKSSWCRR